MIILSQYVLTNIPIVFQIINQKNSESHSKNFLKTLLRVKVSSRFLFLHLCIVYV